MGSTTEMLVRNACTPPLSAEDVSSAEIETKIRLVETWAKRVFFEGGAIAGDAVDAIAMLVLCRILARSDLAKKYGTLNAETYLDYSYELSGPATRGSQFQATPLAIVKGWEEMAIEILRDLGASKKYIIRLAND